MINLAIHSSRTVTPQGIRDAYLLIEDGVITEVANHFPAELDCELIEAGNHILMPGIVDPHVHINEPGRTSWEGFETATKAAIAGGVTTMVDMPLNSSPVTTSVKAFDEKLAAAKGKLNANVGFWGGVVPGNRNEIEPLVKKGVLGFKAFLTHSGIDDFPNVTEEDLRQVMPLIAKHDLPLLVHCELNHGDSIRLSDHRSYKEYLASRPRQWEDDAIALMIRLCEEFHCRTHIVHLSSANSIEQVKKAKDKGLPLTVETAQHYLYFNAEDIANGRSAFKCAPPIREKENNEQLWQALKEGIIDFVATDHSPAPAGLKQIESGDLSKAWGGISSIQFALPALWTAAKKHQCSVEDISRWLCSQPAAFIQKQQRKGIIQAGFDADLVIWDDTKKFTVTEDIIHHRHKITPYLNETLYGVVEQTFIAGRKVYQHGKLVHLNEGKIILHD